MPGRIHFPGKVSEKIVKNPLNCQNWYGILYQSVVHGTFLCIFRQNTISITQTD